MYFWHIVRTWPDKNWLMIKKYQNVLSDINDIYINSI